MKNMKTLMEKIEVSIGEAAVRTASEPEKFCLFIGFDEEVLPEELLQEEMKIHM